VQGQYVGRRVEYFRKTGKDASTLVAEAFADFEKKWQELDTRLEMVPGKSVLADVRKLIQDRYSVSMTDYRIISAYKPAEVPSDLRKCFTELDEFRCLATRGG